MTAPSPKKTFLDRSRERLLRERGALRTRIATELRASGRPEYGTLAGQVHDRGDEALADLLVDVFYAGVAHDLTEARDLDDALERVEAGKYGFCADCGLPIPESRLEAYPTTKRCRSCQEKHEQRAGKQAASL
jgi:RNA polymerase-binding transcription factor DksA